MTFPINSTAYITPVIERLGRVMNRSSVASRINAMGVYNCRQTSGTSLWSPHAIGDAGDLMLKVVSRAEAEAVGRNVVNQATKKTIANRGRPLKEIVHVVFGTTQWIRGQGFVPYTGIAHDNHVHVAGSFSTAKRPPCAG